MPELFRTPPVIGSPENLIGQCESEGLAIWIGHHSLKSPRPRRSCPGLMNPRLLKKTGRQVHGPLCEIVGEIIHAALLPY
jgi:hypothetical protein